MAALANMETMSAFPLPAAEDLPGLDFAPSPVFSCSFAFDCLAGGLSEDLTSPATAGSFFTEVGAGAGAGAAGRLGG